MAIAKFKPTGTPDSAHPELSDRLLHEIGTFECVLKVIERNSDSCDRTSGMASAETVLRRSIETLLGIYGGVEDLESPLDAPAGVTP